MNIFILYSFFADRDDTAPVRILKRRACGYYSSLEQAVRMMLIERTRDDRLSASTFLYCFIVEEFALDNRSMENLREWLYSPDVELLDYRLDIGEFQGRSEAEIRFKVGDIVDVIHRKGGRWVVEPMIVGREPFTPEVLEKYAEELAEDGETVSPEEEYNCLTLNSKEIEYVSPVRVMPLQNPLDTETEKAFKDYLANAHNNKIRFRRRW